MPAATMTDTMIPTTMPVLSFESESLTSSSPSVTLVLAETLFVPAAPPDPPAPVPPLLAGVTGGT